jgi:hypothetical protein
VLRLTGETDLEVEGDGNGKDRGDLVLEPDDRMVGGGVEGVDEGYC